jgi:dihydrolipoamide dehydrogenase
MTTKTYDAIVIGGGPGGYVAGIRLGQLKQKTLVIEKESWGGVCLNWGCIPSKALIAAANFAERAPPAADVMGVKVGEVTVDATSHAGVEERHREEAHHRRAGRSQGQRRRDAQGHRPVRRREDPRGRDRRRDRAAREATKGIIVSTGAQVIELPTLKIDGKKVISAKEGVSLNPLPKRMAIIGGGIIGMELGGVYSKLGVEVTMVEFLPKCSRRWTTTSPRPRSST